MTRRTYSLVETTEKRGIRTGRKAFIAIADGGGLCGKGFRKIIFSNSEG